MMSRAERRVSKILAAGETDRLKIARLQTLALKCFPSSPDQKTVQDAYRELQLREVNLEGTPR